MDIIGIPGKYGSGESSRLNSANRIADEIGAHATCTAANTDVMLGRRWVAATQHSANAATSLVITRATMIRTASARAPYRAPWISPCKGWADTIRDYVLLCAALLTAVMLTAQWVHRRFGSKPLMTGIYLYTSTQLQKRRNRRPDDPIRLNHSCGICEAGCTCSCAATLLALIDEMAGKLSPPIVAKTIDRNACSNDQHQPTASCG